MLPSIISLTDRGCYYSGPMVFGGGSLGFKKIPCPLVVNVFHVFFFSHFVPVAQLLCGDLGDPKTRLQPQCPQKFKGVIF